MPRKSIHWRAVRDYPSFPNNRRSTRFPRRRVVTKRVWKEEESPAYFGVPNTALFTPWDVPNPTDEAPTLVDYHALHYSDAGGYAPAGPCPGSFGGQFPGLGRMPGLATAEMPEVFDPSPFCININVGNGYSSYSTGMLPHGGTWNISIPMYLSYPGMYIGGYKVNVTVYDSNMQAAYMEQEVDGLFSGVIKFLEGIWNGIVGAFSAAWEMVKAAVNWIVDWIKGVIEGFINTVITPIKNGLSNYIARVMNTIGLAFSEYNEKNTISQETVNAIEDALLGWLLQFMQPFSDIMNYIYSFISPFLETIKSLAEDIINFVVNLISPSADSVELPYLRFSDMGSLARNGFEFFGIECNTPTWLEIVLIIADFALGIIALLSLGIEDPSGLRAIGLSLMLGGALSLIGWMVSDLVESTTDETGKEGYKTLSGLLTLIGFSSFILALVGTIKAPKGPVQILGVIALILSGIGLWNSLAPIVGG